MLQYVLKIPSKITPQNDLDHFLAVLKQLGAVKNTDTKKVLRLFSHPHAATCESQQFPWEREPYFIEGHTLDMRCLFI